MRSVVIALLAVVVVSAWPATSGAPLAAEKTAPFTLAVMRRDGVMVPFATFSGGTWLNRWPTPLAAVDVPISLPSVPKAWWGKEGSATAWTMWRRDASTIPVRLLRPVVFDSHCVLGIGLKTDYQSVDPVPPRSVHHHPKDGLVVSGPMPIEPIESLTVRNIEWVTTIPIIAEAIQAARKDRARVSIDPALIAGASSILSALAARSAATSDAWRDAPISLEVLCRTMGQKRAAPVFYFEAEQTFDFRLGKDASTTTLVALSQGFIFETGKAVAGVTVTTSSRGAAEYALPLGALRVGDDLYWAVQWSATGQERYTILRIDPRAATFVISAPGGGC